MMRRVLLIARREVLAYAAIPSFWVALVMGPLLMALAGLAAGAASRPPAEPPRRVVLIHADDAGLEAVVARALGEAAATEGRSLIVLSREASATADATHVQLRSSGAGRLTVRLSGAPLPLAAQQILRRDLERAEARDLARAAGASEQALAAGDRAQVRVETPATVPPVREASDLGRFGRFGMVLLLWMNLVGALGMLLQAIVRERSNRALESLLSSARAPEIILGKLCGVGALSLFMLTAWLGAGALIGVSPLAGPSAGVAGQVLGAFVDPRALALAAVMFVGAFAMYGAALIGLGALARDVPAAQNLSRPVFGVLLLVFFASLAQLVGAGGSSAAWLAWIPLFTPFVLLMAEPGSIHAVPLAGGLMGMALTTSLCIAMASRALQDPSLSRVFRWPKRFSHPLAHG